MIVTVENVMAWGPCPGYSRERVAELVGDGITALEIVALDIPARDRLWALMRPGVMGVAMHLALAAIGERVLTCERAAGREPDPRSWSVVPMLRRLGQGEDAPNDALRFVRVGAWAAVECAWDIPHVSRGWRGWDARDAARSAAMCLSGAISGATPARLNSVNCAARAAVRHVGSTMGGASWDARCDAQSAACDTAFAASLRVCHEVLATGNAPPTPDDLSYDAP